MARMRTLKPEACSSESLASVPRAVRWTFATFWTHCDDEGRAAWNLRLIKAALYPLDDDVSIAVLEHEFDMLEEIGAVCRYEVAGRQYVHVPAFGEHQHPNRRVASPIPPCLKSDHTRTPHAQRSEPAVSTHEHLTPVVVGEGRGDVDVDVDGAPFAAPAQKRGTRLPDSWRPSHDDRTWTLERITSELAALELEKFKNHWQAKTGKDATKLDWGKTWRNWVLNTSTYGGPARAAPQGSTADQRVNDGLALAAELRREQAHSSRGLTA